MAIARYVEGDMDVQEQQQFELLLAENEMMRTEVESYKQIHASLKMHIAPDTKDKKVVETLQTMNQQYFKAEAKTFSIKPYIRYISVAAVLIIGLLVWAPWSGGLYQQYRISKEMSVAERGTSSHSNLAQGAVLYNKGDYEGAKKVLQKEYMVNPRNPLLAYYFAITLIENDKEADARTILADLYKGESAFKYDAAYYAALSYVREKDKQGAISWLQKIPSDNVNYTLATELLKKLQE